MNDIRLLLTINNLDTAGMKYVLADIAEGLDPKEFQVSIGITRRSGTDLEKRLENQFPLHVLPLRVSRSQRLLFPFRQWNLGRKLKGISDLAHGFDYSSDWSEALAFKSVGIPFIAEKTNLIYSERKWARKLGWATHIIGLSQAQKEQLKTFQNKVTIIPTGIDLERFENAEPFSRKMMDIGKDRVIAISVAHLVDVKGYEELIEALARVKDRYPEFLVIAVGKGDPTYERYLKDKADGHGVSNMIQFIGPSDRVPELLKMADLKILTTQNRGRREGFGAAIVEAMAAGLPVLATRSGGPEDIVVDGQTGWLIPGDGPESIVNGIHRIFQDRQNWNAYGQKGQQRAREQYNKKLMVKRYAEVYRKVLGGRSEE